MRLSPILLLAIALACPAQTVKEVRATAKQGANALPQLGDYLKSPDTAVRLEAVKSIVDIGTPKSLDYLIQATRDVDDSIQIRATNGLVNFYLPGYVPANMTAKLQRAGTNLKARFLDDRNDQVIDPFIVVRPDVIQAIAGFVRAGSSAESRANAARALGVLHASQAVPQLLEGLRSKDSDVLFETVVALQKIRDPSAGPKIQFLLHDLKERVQLAAIEATGVLSNQAALPDLRTILSTTNKAKVKRTTLTAISMLPDPQDRGLYTAFLREKDESLRSSAAEGFGRLRNPDDAPMLEKAYEDEGKKEPRLSLAFALVLDGKIHVSDDSPMRFLIDQLNSASTHSSSQALLTELARDPKVRAELYAPMEQGTRDEKIGIAQILAQTGDSGAEPHVEKISRDGDKQVAAEGLRALRNLRARL